MCKQLLRWMLCLEVTTVADCVWGSYPSIPTSSAVRHHGDRTIILFQRRGVVALTQCSPEGAEQEADKEEAGQATLVVVKCSDHRLQPLGAELVVEFEL
ncbi:hypothetical protein J6590_027266 [Homalodisca vitripennis]|nr:hypothetical protein J6590_027266 [Homalodisca vitripennis]